MEEKKHCKWYNAEFCTNDKSPCVADYCPVVEYPELCKFRETGLEKKKIHVFFINKIKNLDYKIFEYQDEDCVNTRAVKNCERHIENWLAKAGVERKFYQEVLSCINWADDNCVEKLEKLGWTVIRGEDEWKKRNLTRT